MKRPEQRRRAALQAIMHEKGVSVLLVTRREDVRYLTGFSGSAGSVLVTAKRAFLITDFRYKLQAGRETSGITVLIQKKDMGAAVHTALQKLGTDDLWYDESALTVELVKQFRKSGVRMRGSRDLVRPLRMRKDAGELSSIKKAIRRAEDAFRRLARFIRPGSTERELGMKLEFLMRERGSRRAAFDTIVASAGNGAMPHASVTDRRIKKGDLVTFDFGAEADGYYCDMTRTYCVGRPSPMQRDIHALVLKAQDAAVRVVRPGLDCRSVDAAAREIIKSAGHAKQFGHGTGHGIGLMVHEGPSVSSLSKDVVQQDMVFTIEPGVYVPGWGGVRIEDMVQVTAGSVRMLTSLPREIDSLGRLVRG